MWLDMRLQLQEVDTSRISSQSAYEGSKFVSPKHRSPLPARIYEYPWYSLILDQCFSTAGPRPGTGP
jgi:hypothetical protein